METANPIEDQPRLELLFKKPDFPLGELSTTLRRGSKWAGAEGAEAELFGVNSETDEKVATGCFARIVGTHVFSGGLDELSEEAIASNHDADARTREGLRAAMFDAYGLGFDPSEPVTLVTFEAFCPEPLGSQEPPSELAQASCGDVPVTTDEEEPQLELFAPDAIQEPNTKAIVRAVARAVTAMAPDAPKTRVVLFRKVIKGLQDELLRH